MTDPKSLTEFSQAAEKSKKTAEDARREYKTHLDKAKEEHPLHIKKIQVLVLLLFLLLFFFLSIFFDYEYSFILVFSSHFFLPSFFLYYLRIVTKSYKN